MAETTDSEKVKAVTSTIMEAAVNGAIVAAKAYVPFLNWPVFKQVFEFLVDRIAGLIETELALYISFMVIQSRNDANAKAANVASENLKKAIGAVSPDPQQIAQAKDDFKNALKNLIRIKPSTSNP